MPRRVASAICMSCRKTFQGEGTKCRACRPADTRPSNADRGYDHAWRKVRAEVLEEHGIPRELWSKYAVDHNPRYNAAVEPDHRKYNLIPRLMRDHNRKTAIEDTRRDYKGRFSGTV